MEKLHSDITSDKSKIKVADNSCYDLSYDSVKNRIYLTIRGFWKTLDAVPHYLDDWQKVLKLKMPGFTVLANLQDMVTHPQTMNILHIQAQQLVMEQQVYRIAHVTPSDKIAKLQVDSIADQTGIPAKDFDFYQDAELWLDEPTEPADLTD